MYFAPKRRDEPVPIFMERRFTLGIISNGNRGFRTLYAANVLRLRLPLDSGVSGKTVSVHGGDWR
jgi:hypothetical protein